MKIVKAIVTVLLGIVFLGLIWGFFIDPKWNLTVRQQVGADEQTVFSQLNSLQQWPNWTVWNTQNFPKMTMSHEGPVSGVGATQRWNDGSMEGVITITSSTKNQYVEYQLSMDNGEITMNGQLSLDPRGANTLVTWRLWGNSGNNPIGRIMMKAYIPMIRKDLEVSLSNLNKSTQNQQPTTQPQ